MSDESVAYSKQKGDRKDGLTGQHVRVGTIADGKDVRGHFCAPLALVQVDDTWCVDRVPLVWIDGHTEQTRVGLFESHA